VTSSPAGITNCTSGTCTHAFTINANVELTATPVAGYRVQAWTGACSGSGTTCNVSMFQDRSVTVTFELDN
jgi:hypothetical protein